MIHSIIAPLTKVAFGPSITYIAPLDHTRANVFFANHSSHLDFLVIWASLPSDLRKLARPVAARDYWTKGPVRRFIASRLFGGLLIERRKPTEQDNPVQQMIDLLDSGQSLILFPEATRGTGDEIASFRSGLFQIREARPNVALIPVNLENLNRILPKGEFVAVPMLSRVTFGEPLAAIPGESRNGFLERARLSVAALEQGA